MDESMKAMEAPKKIYLTQLMLFATPTISSSDNDVEYIRTDAFIEKAAKWLEDNAIEYWGTEAVDNGMMIVEFKKAMELWHRNVLQV